MNSPKSRWRLRSTRGIGQVQSKSARGWSHRPKTPLIVTILALLMLIDLLPSQARTVYSRVVKPAAKLAVCMPAEIRLDEVAEFKGRRKITIAEKLKNLRARCSKGKLVTPDHREIRFYRLACWGFPPPDYQAIQAEQRRKIKELESKYQVILIGCDPRIP
jgi:hypothetical protein